MSVDAVLSACLAGCRSVSLSVTVCMWGGGGDREGRETETERHREISVHLGMFYESEILVCLSSY